MGEIHNITECIFIYLGTKNNTNLINYTPSHYIVLSCENV